LISFKPSDEEAAFIMVAKDFATEYFRPMARDAERNDFPLPLKYQQTPIRLNRQSELPQSKSPGICTGK